MADLEYTIRPLLGLKTSVPQNDPSLFRQLGENDFLTHAVDGVNFDVLKRRNTCSKAVGRDLWGSRCFPAEKWFTESDASSRVSMSNDRVSWASLDNDETAYTYYDMGANALNGDFVFRGNFNVSAISSGQDVYIWAVGDTLNSIDNNTDYLYFKITEDSGDLVAAIGYYQDASGDSTNASGTYGTLSIGTDYSFKITRDESTGSGTLKLDILEYRTGYPCGEPLATLLSSGTVTLNAKKDYRYWFTLQNDSSGGGGQSCNGYVETNMESGFTLAHYSNGMFQLEDSSYNARLFHIIDGDLYRSNLANDYVHVGGTSGDLGADDILCNIIRFGDYAIYTRGNTTYTPYAIDWNDVTDAKLISSGTEYRIKYLESFHLYIIGANINTSDVTNGDISIIWSNRLPTPTSDCTFGSGDPPSNHLFRGNDDPITGIKRMGHNSCFLYGRRSIDVIDYFPNYQTPFSIRSLVSNEGAANQHSIIDTGNRHFLFNRNYGFCEYRGENEFPSGGRPISEPIEDKIADISYDETDHINGVFDPTRQEAIWCVPADGATSPNQLWFYNIVEGIWRIQDFAARSLCVLDSNYPFDTTEKHTLLSQDKLEIFQHIDDDDDESDFDGYRVEPILQWGRPFQRSLIDRIWFSITNTGSYSIDVYQRSGDTVGEVEAASWTSIGSVSCNSVDNPVVQGTQNEQRYHQIKWGCDAKDEPFEVNAITFEVNLGAKY